MEQLLRSTDPDAFFYPLKEGAVLDEDYKGVQTVSKFLGSNTRHNVTPERHTLLIYHLGTMTPRFRALSDRLASFMRAFFGLTVIVRGDLVVEELLDKSGNKFVVRSPSSLDGYIVRSQTASRETYTKSGKARKKRKTHHNVTELHAIDLLKVLKEYAEADTFVVVGLMAWDIFNPNYTDDVIMGYSGYRSCVISIPQCYDSAISGPKTADRYALFEMVKTAAHEISHNMGLNHCVEYSCIMNSQYVKETPDTAIYFCPQCVYKLYRAARFDCKGRWEELLKFYTMNRFKGAATWVARRIKQWEKDCEKSPAALQNHDGAVSAPDVIIVDEK